MDADRADSEVQGVITAEGLFDGVIRDGDEEFFVEPAHRYFPYAGDQHRKYGQKEEHTANFHGSEGERTENNMNATSSRTRRFSDASTFHSVIYKVCYYNT